MVYKLLFLLLLFAYNASAELDIRCTAAYCTAYITDTGCDALSTSCQVQNSTHHGTFLPYADVCNCCDYCLTDLEEGDQCISGAPGQLPPNEICGPGLICTTNDDDQATCQKSNIIALARQNIIWTSSMSIYITLTSAVWTGSFSSDVILLFNLTSTICTQAQLTFDEKRNNGTLGSRQIRPQCDNDGLYKPAHCIPGSICYCVDPTGERIFGEMPHLNSWDENSMSCGCSLNAWKAQNTLDPSFSIPVARCLSNGQFDPVQCMNGTNATCLCVNTATGAPILNIAVVNITGLSSNTLSCFDPSIHTNGTYNTTCELAKETLKAEGVTDVELLPSCQIDGRYARVQYSGTKKICTDPDGVQIGQYEALSNSTEGVAMNCNCARTRWLLNEAGVTELPTCCDFGSYEAWQCHRHECFCVDENGNQIEREVHISQVENLSCYITNNGDACTVT